MTHALQLYIDGAWVDPVVSNRFAVIDPSIAETSLEVDAGLEDVLEIEGILGYEAA